MKKFLLLLMITVVIGATSCKKDQINNTPAPAKNKAVTVETQKHAVYDYQQAIRVKRSSSGSN